MRRKATDRWLFTELKDGAELRGLIATFLEIEPRPSRGRRWLLDCYSRCGGIERYNVGRTLTGSTKGCQGSLASASSSLQFLDGKVLVSVSDTGVGLPPEKPDQIFEAFFTTKPQGSGMGLAISRSIVESHGGHIWATANAGRGATFHFTLPVVVEATQAVAAGKQAELSEPAL